LQLDAVAGCYFQRPSKIMLDMLVLVLLAQHQ